ncbi:hypothetical protein ACFQLX_10495 [Streptomyces polyrhachis]|uniref:Uncharacterized protein n=1 Tax=Streptomyces polyrhachis TaxID=1282885 RepID=A0ABW2GIB6_9ACTN
MGKDKDNDKGNIDVSDAAFLDTAARRYAASQGWAMENDSYPIRPADMHGAEDLHRAIHAVGRGSEPHDEIRRHIMDRAKALGLSAEIPSDWNTDGSLSG